jgi:hypothetical protein
VPRVAVVVEDQLAVEVVELRFRRVHKPIVSDRWTLVRPRSLLLWQNPKSD